MTLHQLRIFEAVAKHLNITKASEELHITQPSVSQQLKFLEEECGVKLYKKMSRGVELTDRGQLFLKDVEPLLSRVDRLKEQFNDRPTDRKAGPLTIGSSHSQAVSFIPLLLAAFKETHPEVQLALRTGTSRLIEQLVLNSEVELAVITNPSQSPALTCLPYREKNFVAFISPTHPLAKKKELSLAELAQSPLIFKKGRTTHERVWKHLKQVEQERGYKLNVVMHSESTQAVKAAVRTGMGLGILFQDHVEQEIKRGELKRVKIPELKMKLTSFIVHLRGASLSPHAQDFLTLLCEWSKKKQVAKDLPMVA